MLTPLSASDRPKALRPAVYNSLSLNEQLVLGYFLAKISFSRVPVNVPLRFPAYKLGMDKQKVQYNVKKLIKKGLLERWSPYVVKGGKVKKVSYYRIKEGSLG